MTDLVTGISFQDRQAIQNVTESMTPESFHWGTVLWPLVVNIVNSWKFKSEDLAGHPEAAELGQYAHELATLPTWPHWKDALKSGEQSKHSITLTATYTN